MVNEPVNWVERCSRAGGDRIIGHVEMMSDIAGFIAAVTSAGLSPGIAIDITTPVESLEEEFLLDIDVVLVMSIPAGFGGQKFDTRALAKIKKLNEIRQKDPTPFRICDDGGITIEYIDDLDEQGVDEVVIGRRIFEGDLAKNINAYKKSI
jgi:ribulose-phosphate 3-epimerase